MPDPCCTHSLPPGSPAHTTLRTRSHSGHQTIMATSSNASLRYSSIRFLRITNLPTSATNQPTASAPKNNCAWATHLAIARHISEHHTRPTYYVLTLTRQTFRPLFQQYGDMLHKLPGVTARHTSGCGVSTANSSSYYVQNRCYRTATPLRGITPRDRSARPGSEPESLP
jgi:hypothetical protein